MTIKGLLFDKDGTIIDFNNTWLPLYQTATDLLATLPGATHSGAQLMQAGGFNAADNSWLADSVLASGSNLQILEHWQQLTGIHIDANLQQQLEAIFASGNTAYTPVVADLNNWFGSLRCAGYAIGIATMDDEAHARQVLEDLGAMPQVDFICGADSGFGVKPEPGMVQAFCAAVDVPADMVAVIGDSPRDLKMARNAGCARAVGVLTGASNREDLAPLADAVLDDIAALPALLKSNARRLHKLPSAPIND